MICLQIPEQIRTLQKFPRVFEKKLSWKEWKHSYKVWTSFVVSLKPGFALDNFCSTMLEREAFIEVIRGRILRYFVFLCNSLWLAEKFSRHFLNQPTEPCITKGDGE